VATTKTLSQIPSGREQKFSSKLNDIDRAGERDLNTNLVIKNNDFSC
jgi:hypothetical protein